MLASVCCGWPRSCSQSSTLKPIPTGAVPPEQEMYRQPSSALKDAVSPVSMSPKVWLTVDTSVPGIPTPLKTQYGSSEPSQSTPLSSFAWNETAFTVYLGCVGHDGDVRPVAQRPLSNSDDSATTWLESAVKRTAM